MPATDTLGRPLRELRVSVTDRCNFRCPYCMPREAFGPDHPFLAQPELMTRDELRRIVSAFAACGVEKIRLTGGEPLLRTDLADIVRDLRALPGLREVSLTTNGWFLGRQAASLRAAGLDRVNVSLDAIDPDVGGRMNGLGFDVTRVIAGIDQAAAAGLPVKVNCVVQRGVNEGQILPLCDHFRSRGHPIRFIEYMDVGNTNHWSHAQVVPAADIVGTISSRWPLDPVDPAFRGEVASRYRYRDGAGEVGVVSSVTAPFCRDCHRARLSANGRLYTCLFASQGWDILGRVRSGARDEDLAAHIRSLWSARSDRYSEERAGILARGSPTQKIEMSYIGG
jgi:GTP 3',8-cyclase